MTRRRRATLGYTVAERDALFRWGYLEHYAADPAFGRDLVAMYAEHAARLVPLPFDPSTWWRSAASDREDVRTLRGIADPVPILAYREAVRAVCRRYGLDRLRPPGDWLFPGLEVGEWLVHAWCQMRGEMAARGDVGRRVVGGKPLGLAEFTMGYGVASMVPDTAGGTWDPRSETYAAARARLGWRHARNLEAIAERVEREGLVSLDSRPELRRDLGWLYRHVAHGETFPAIAAADLGDTFPTGPDTVRRAVERMARCVLRSDYRSGR